MKIKTTADIMKTKIVGSCFILSIILQVWVLWYLGTTQFKTFEFLVAGVSTIMLTICLYLVIEGD